jgi:hypothetical protein
MKETAREYRANRKDNVRQFHQDRSDVEGVELENFYAYLPRRTYVFAPSREMWPASSVRLSGDHRTRSGWCRRDRAPR